MQEQSYGINFCQIKDVIEDLWAKQGASPLQSSMVQAYCKLYCSPLLINSIKY